MCGLKKSFTEKFCGKKPSYLDGVYRLIATHGKNLLHLRRIFRLRAAARSNGKIRFRVPFLRLLSLQSLPETKTQKSAQAYIGDSGRTQAHAHGYAHARS